MIIKQIPIVSLRKAVFKLLKEGQKTPIYGTVSTQAKLPYITIGALTFKPLQTKDLTIWQNSLQIDVWADKNGKLQVNETLNDICILLSVYGKELELEEYTIIDCNINLVEDFPELTTGHHGVVTVDFTLQQKE